MVSIRKIPQRLNSIVDDLQDFQRKRKATPLQGDPIIIASVPRSGSTMLGELLNSAQVMLYHEPFIKHNILWNRTLADKRENSPIDTQMIRAIWESIRQQQAWVYYRKSNSRYPYLTKGALHKHISLPPRRIILKGPSLNYWLDHLLEITGPAFPILLFRDPRAITASLKRLDWDPIDRLHILYNHPWFADKLPDGILAYRDPISTLQPVERMALQTATLHHFLLQQKARFPEAFVIYFEELVTRPTDILHQLALSAGLPEYYVPESRISEILHANDNSDWKHRYKRNATAHIRPWTNILTESEESFVNRVYTQINPPYPIQ